MLYHIYKTGIAGPPHSSDLNVIPNPRAGFHLMTIREWQRNYREAELLNR